MIQNIKPINFKLLGFFIDNKSTSIACKRYLDKTPLIKYTETLGLFLHLSSTNTKRTMTRIWTSLMLVTMIACIPKKEQKPVSSFSKYIKNWSPDGLPMDMILLLNEKGDQIDYNFSTGGVSMNQSGNGAVKQDLSLISLTPLSSLPENCIPLARKVYYGRGELLLEANVYYSQDCIFQVFIKNEQYLYGNLFNENGLRFYNNLLQQIQQNNPNK